MGEVLKTLDTRLDCLVALKTLPPGKTADEDHKRRMREAAAKIRRVNMDGSGHESAEGCQANRQD